MSPKTVGMRTLARRQAADHVTVVTIGEVDASNARQFADAVLALADGPRRLTLDLSRVTFMAVEGLSALHAINAHVMRAGAEWEVQPSPEVQRLLAVCQVESLLRVLPAGASRARPLRHVVGRSA